ncbi:MAG TPA: ATP-binding protein [Gemmatimonadaceae bacterium]
MAPSPARRSRFRSIQWRLPLLISALLLCVIAVLGAVVYAEVRGALVRAGEERVQAVTQRIAALLDDAVRRLAAEATGLAADSVVVRALEAPGEASARAARARLAPRLAGAGQLAALELRASDGTRALLVGPESGEPAPLPDASSGAPGTVVRVGALTARGDTVSYLLAAPVRRVGGDTIGWLVEHRRIDSAPTRDMLRELIGASARFLIGNRDGSVWTDFVHRTDGPPLDARASVPVPRDTTGGARLGAIAEIPGTRWVAWVGEPVAAIIAPARVLLRRLLLVSLLVLAAGALGGWALSRSITVPLGRVVRAAEGVAGGDHSQRVGHARSEELDRLATSFNVMAARVEEERNALESRVAERTAELTTALDRLHAAQEELVRKEKLALLGQLAGGVGHELRNPLGVMTNAVHYLGLVLRDAPPTVVEYLGILRAQIGLAERIVGDLLDSARVRPPQREPVAAARLVADQLERMGPTPGVDVRLDVPADLPHACVDRVQTGQVLLNLLTNGVQAMAERGGTLTVRARVEEGARLRIDVSDTGPGIAPEHLERVFEPLFTTKARGLGLGLSVARTLARVNGGDIAVASRPGAGSTFTLTMPTIAGTSA